ncbi:amino acid permease 2 [Artemisia annua]|uniref:Amino acid permease 2 n=1 Tax=Artemisia annua TaxID=35608 RepID=A0A2U1MUS7_ARTAN|nr:amino acid permease 2 [Artemisia annua]
MGQETTTGELEIAGFAPQAPSKFFDDDGRLKRTGTVWTTSAHIITADTIKSPPAEHKTMKKATLISVATTTVFYMFCGCFGYAAFGDMAPGNLLTGFGFYNPYWLIDIANGAIIIHLIGAYQVYCQPLFAFVENTAAKYFPESKFINNNIEIPIPFGGYKPYKLNMFRLVWRTAFVCMTTIVAMLMPFFNDVVGIIGAFGFWPLTVYFPVKMYIVQKKIPKWSSQWILLQILSVVCLIISIFAAVGSFAGVVIDLKVYKPFKTISRISGSIGHQHKSDHHATSGFFTTSSDKILQQNVQNSNLDTPSFPNESTMVDGP